jgi:hypothetical protein
MDFNTGTSHEAQHLCVLVHGYVTSLAANSHCVAKALSRLWGNPNHLEVMARSLRDRYPQEVLHILVAKRNSGNFTYDGIELGGERVCQERAEEIDKLAKAGQQINRLSMVGYSLGGLVARYAIGLLHSKGFFERITPVVSFPSEWANAVLTRIEFHQLCKPPSGCADTSYRFSQSPVGKCCLFPLADD